MALTFLLVILHQDFWWWDDRTTVFGFLPIGLAWHVGISIAAGLVGLLAVTFCWPETLDEEGNGEGKPPGAPFEPGPRDSATTEDG